jgi:general secretion pathway protein J
MTAGLRHRAAEAAGFSMIEVLAAVLLMTLILAALGVVTSQWMPNWNRGIAQVQQIERLAVGLDRIAADLTAAEYVPLNNTTQNPLFDGGPLSLSFVRTAIGPSTSRGLEVVRLSEKADKQGLALVRERTAFVPMRSDAPVQFGDLVVLIRAPYRISFSYAGSDGAWRGEWQSMTELPRRVRVNVRDAVSARVLGVSTVVEIAANAKPDCVRAKNIGQCLLTGQVTDLPRPGEAPRVDPTNNPALNPPARDN